MELSRIKYLREELDGECIDLVELAEIEEAFKQIDPSTLRDLPENALAGDMLDELEDRVGIVERTIYNWVSHSFGESEALDPSWNIKALAEEIESIPMGMGAEVFSLGQLTNGEV